MCVPPLCFNDSSSHTICGSWHFHKIIWNSKIKTCDKLRLTKLRRTQGWRSIRKAAANRLIIWSPTVTKRPFKWAHLQLKWENRVRNMLTLRVLTEMCLNCILRHVETLGCTFTCEIFTSNIYTHASIGCPPSLAAAAWAVDAMKATPHGRGAQRGDMAFKNSSSWVRQVVSWTQVDHKPIRK